MVVLVPPRFSGSSIVIFHGQPVFSVVGEGRADSAPVLREHVSVRIVSEGDPCRPILNGDNCALGVDRHGDRLGAFCLDGLEIRDCVQGLGDRLAPRPKLAKQPVGIVVGEGGQSAVPLSGILDINRVGR